MILYSYICTDPMCGHIFDLFVENINERDKPCETEVCLVCGEPIRRMLGCCAFKIPEGASGNAANGYSSYHGDSEIFKRKNRRK